MNGEPRLECLSDGMWDFDPPRCQPVDCGSPGDLKNGFVLGIYEANFTLTLYNATMVLLWFVNCFCFIFVCFIQYIRHYVSYKMFLCLLQKEKCIYVDVYL